MKRTHFQLAILAGLVATFVQLPRANAELVYEDSPSQAARVDDRALTREALGASEKAQVTLQQQAPAQQQVVQQQVVAAPAVAAAPVAAPVAAPIAPAQVQVGAAQIQQDAAAPEEVQNYSKSELIRRARLREEMKNEDVLQERLEELRLRDEQRRTQQILGGAQGPTGDVSLPAPIYGASGAAVGASGATGATGAAVSVQQAPETEKVGAAAAAAAPVVEAKAAQAPAGALAATGATTVASADMTPVGGASSMSASLPGSENSDKLLLTVSPRFGINGMADQGAFQVSSKFATGVALSVAATDNFSLELGYTYGEYGINVLSSSPLVESIQSAVGGTNDSMTMKQNVIDLNAKLYLVGSDSRIRPFVGLGGGYGLSYVNYSSQILNYINQMGYQQALGSDYNLNSILGDLSAGMDVKVAKNISVGVTFKYYRVFSSTESNNIFNGNYVNYNAFAVVQNPDKQFVSDSMANASFYSALAGVSFTF